MSDRIWLLATLAPGIDPSVVRITEDRARQIRGGVLSTDWPVCATRIRRGWEIYRRSTVTRVVWTTEAELEGAVEQLSSPAHADIPDAIAAAREPEYA